MRRVLDDGDIVLRPLVARDAGELFLLAESYRADLRKYMTWVDRTKAVADVNFYILSLDGFWKAGHTFGVFQDDLIMGTVGFHNGDHRNEKVEVGYWLAPPFQGKGLASRAVRLAIDAAFKFTAVHRIEAKICPSNKASMALVKKLGFQLEGLERQGIKFGDDFRDHHVFSVLRNEWRVD